MTQPPQVAARAKPKPPSTPSNADKHKAAAGRQAAQPQQNANVKLKVVVRGLPPNLPEHKFNEVTAQWINQTTVDWYYYVGGKLHDRGNKPSVRSRAYAKFKSVDALITFHKAFNGHIFTDSKGRSSRAMIEFAPFQKYVKGKQKADTRQGTIDTSPEYKEFLDFLAQPPATEPVTTTDNEHTTTPLIEYLRAQKAAKAEKDRINREKLKASKVAATKAKANAQKVKTGKVVKAVNTGDAKAGGEQVREGKQVAIRGGRGGSKAVNRAAQRARTQQQGSHEKTEGPAASSTMSSSIAHSPVVDAISVDVAAGSGAAAASPNSATSVPQQGFRGRGRGGRARPHGVYRPGAGRGGRRGGIGAETKPTTNSSDGG